MVKPYNNLKTYTENRCGLDDRPVVELDIEFMYHSYQFMLISNDSEMNRCSLNLFAMKTMGHGRPSRNISDYRRRTK